MASSGSAVCAKYSSTPQDIVCKPLGRRRIQGNNPVVEPIFTTKNPRKKRTKYEIAQDGWYVLFEIKENVLYVINAK